ncbi:hypothetical protein E2N92_05060 [Methanofollis formosanus]|uniref:Uncharacterized protein n=1 Tax=Methanofollis formosanus TaxID=299308 RepID=A0A8G1EGE6_9EURY|nr:hypothetical protein [Methanofollis formosanus]QYZ78842.1 hypothetical protein E2N92_05060 [Methanofollis formosanus]
MRVHNREWLMREGGVVVLVLALSVLLLRTAPEVITGPIPSWSGVPAAFCLGFLVPGALALLLEERTRPGGATLLALTVPLFSFSFLHSPAPASVALLAGLGTGAAVAIGTFWKNRADILSWTARFVVKLFSVTLAVVIILLLVSAPVLSLGGGLAVLLALTLLVLWSVRRVRRTETFILGPKGSGKTLLLLAMYSHLVREFSGQREEVIFAGDEEQMRIEHLLSDLEDGTLPPPTEETGLAVYRLSGRRFQVAPVRTAFIDYAGKYAAPLSRAAYADALKRIAAAVGAEPRRVEAKIRRFEYLQHLKEDHAAVVAGEMDALVPVCVHRHLETAGKVLFLIDGDHIVGFHQDGRRALTHLFGQYSRVMEALGDDRVYGFVVTKTDRIRDLAEVDDASEGAERIEREIYQQLIQISTFNEIHNRALSVPVYFLAVSTDATLRPAGAGEGNGREEVLRQLYPWRIGELARFGF